MLPSLEGANTSSKHRMGGGLDFLFALATFRVRGGFVFPSNFGFGFLDECGHSRERRVQWFLFAGENAEHPRTNRCERVFTIVRDEVANRRDEQIGQPTI